MATSPSPSPSPAPSPLPAPRGARAARWTGTLLAVLLLSRSLGASRAFLSAPTGLGLGLLLASLGALLAVLASLAVVVYAEERARGRVSVPRPWLDRLSRRLFPDSVMP